MGELDFGEIAFETSRAFADDEDEFLDGPTKVQFRLQIGLTDAGQKSLKKNQNHQLLCVFVGKVALGFGDGFLNGKNGAVLLQNIYFDRYGSSGDSAENENDELNRNKSNNSTSTADSLLKRGEKPVIQIFSLNSAGVILAFVDDYGYTLSLANTISKGLHHFIEHSNRTVVFYSDFKNQTQGEALTFIKTSKVELKEIAKLIKPYPQPKLISGVSAAVLLFCELVKKPGLLLISSGDSEDINSITLAPFLNGIRSKSSESNENGIFSQISQNLSTLQLNPLDKKSGNSLSHQGNLYM